MRTESFTRDLINVQNDLLRFAYKLTANHEDANDLLQETSLKALDNEEKYAAETNFKGWMYTIMRNLLSTITARLYATRPTWTRPTTCSI